MEVLLVLIHIPGRGQRGGGTFSPFPHANTHEVKIRDGQGNANRPRSAHAYARLDGTIMMRVGRQDEGGRGWMDARRSVGRSVIDEQVEGTGGRGVITTVYIGDIYITPGPNRDTLSHGRARASPESKMLRGPSPPPFPPRPWSWDSWLVHVVHPR